MLLSGLTGCIAGLGHLPGAGFLRLGGFFFVFTSLAFLEGSDGFTHLLANLGQFPHTKKDKDDDQNKDYLW
jgi:hypothetical protein